MSTALVKPEVTASAGPVSPPVIVAPAVPVYTQNFEGGTLAGWEGHYADLRVTNERPHTGAKSLEVTPPLGTMPKAVRCQIDGLTVGQQYRFTAWIWTDNSGPATGFAVGMTTANGDMPGGLSEVYYPAAFEGWHLMEHTFAPTVTSGWLYIKLEYTSSVGPVPSWIDDVRLEIPETTSDLLPFPVSGGTVTLDESWSPYAQASVDVPLSDLELLERIDPRQAQRVVLTASETIGGSTRTFDLGLRSRTVDHKAGKATLELASDEALLFDRKNLATASDSTPRQHEASLRGVCQWALDKVGATLSAGTADADMTATWEGTNLIPNPGGGNTTAGWVAGGSGGTIAAVATPGHTTNPYVLRVSNAAAGYTAGPFFSTGSTAGIRVTAGKDYTTTCWVRSNRAVSVRLAYQWVTNGTGSTPANPVGATVTLTANVWTKLTLTARVPANVERLGPYVYLASGSYPASSYIDIDEVMVYDAFEGPLPEFNGGTPDNALYRYDWDDPAAPFNSQSTRTPLNPRPRELFNWTPGQSLNDFLKPLLEASGLLLFCDEQRTWRLIDPTAYEVPGFVVVQAGHNATEGSDTISRNTDEWGTGVLVRYRWTDADGIAQEAFDAAGTPEKVITIERESEYPGPGAAAYFLNSRTGRGRVQEVTALVDYTATPGNDVSIDLPGTLKQIGKVRRVTFGLSDGLMDLGTRGLTDTLPGSWAAWDPDQTWAEVTPTLKWKDA